MFIYQKTRLRRRTVKLKDICKDNIVLYLWIYAKTKTIFYEEVYQSWLYEKKYKISKLNERKPSKLIEELRPR